MRLRGYVRRILRPVRHARCGDIGRGYVRAAVDGCGGAAGWGRRRLLRQEAVELGQIRRHAGQLLRDRGEIRGQPGNDGTMRRFGHGAIVAARRRVCPDE